MTEKGSTLTSSMHRDLMKNSPIEADQIIGDLLTRGKQAHVQTPLLATAYANLAIYQTSQAPKRLIKHAGCGRNGGPIEPLT